MATGENAGTWGTKTNANLNLAEQLLGGFKIQTLNAAGTGVNTTALAVANGALTGAAQNRVIILGAVSPQAIAGAKTVTFPLLAETFYFIKNSTSGAHTVTLKAASGSGATVVFSATDKGYKVVYLDGVATNTGVIEVPLGADGDVTLTGTQTLTNKTLTSPVINTPTTTSPRIVTNILDSNGNELFNLTATSSAVNELTYANAATGNKPTLTASGGDTNISLAILPKGSGQITLDNLTFPAADGSANQILKTNGSGALSFIDQSSGGTDWQAVKTSSFTAVAGEGYFCNTTSSAITVTLPSSPSIGDELELTDYTRKWATNNVTININGKKFQSGTTNPIYNEDGQSVKIVYSDTAEGWIPVRDDVVTDESIPRYTITHLTVAGGAGGGKAKPGGGGAGGMLTSSFLANEGIQLTCSIGAGGAGANSGSVKGTNGGNSSIAGTGITNITSIGGGGGGSDQNTAGADGGSGGGGSGESDADGGSGTSGQGSNGGDGISGGAAAGGGGGGKNAAGANGTSNTGGNGGAGLASSITGSSVQYAGGGGGANENASGGSGGAGGGGGGAQGSAGNGTANTGGGGGASHEGTAGTGGSGIIVLSMPDASYSGTVSGSPTVATNVGGAGVTTIKFTGTGTYTT